MSIVLKKSGEKCWGRKEKTLLSCGHPPLLRGVNDGGGFFIFVPLNKGDHKGIVFLSLQVYPPALQASP